MQRVLLPDSFQSSYLNAASYPENLLHRSTNTYPTALKAYKERLDAAEADLLIEHASKVEVPFRDIHNSSGEGTSHALVAEDLSLTFLELEKYNIHSSSKLTSWLGVDVTADPHDPTRRTASARKRDPKCRLM